MLWNIIRDWFVQYIFGGVDSLGNTHNLPLGENLDNFDAISTLNIGMGDWLSTTATIITLVLLIIMLLSLVRFIVRQVSGLFAKI